MEALVRFYKNQNGLITIALDGESAIYQSDSKRPLSIGQSSFDYIQAIRNIIKDLPINFKFHWVEGHQKEKGLTLDWWARKNDYVDGKAKEFLQRCLCSLEPPYMQTRLLHECWAFSLRGVKLSRINKSHLYQELFGPRTLKYWNDHHDIPIPANYDINWKASQAAAKKLPQGLRRWRAKFASRWIGVGTKLKSYKWQDHSTCPLCNAPSEKISQILKPSSSQKQGSKRL